MDWSDLPPPPTPPTDDARWGSSAIPSWRSQSAIYEARTTEEILVENEQTVVEILHDYGVSELTPDLIYVLWATIGMSFGFIRGRVSVTCQSPQCSHATLYHTQDALAVLGASILRLERRIGERI